MRRDDAVRNRGEGSMTDFCDKAIAFCVSEDGLTTTEYAIMLALIVLVALTAISGMSMKVDGVFTTIGSGLSGGAAS